MRLSHYLKTYPYPEKPGHTLVYSTKKASVLLLPDEFLRGLKQQESVGDSVEQFVSLIKLGVLVPDLREEQESIFTFNDRINRANTTLTVSVILGMECNFACSYCYEGTMKGKHSMTDATADQLIAFIKKRFSKGKTKLILDFYGGEPLLYTNRIKYIAKTLKPYIEEKDGVFEFTLVTNGSLLTRKIAEELAGFGLKSAKITIDGPPANHNRFRPFKSGKASFEVILNNVKASCDVIKIAIGGNFTNGNYWSFPALLDIFAEAGLTPDTLRQVKFDPVMQINDEFSLPEFQSGCGSINEPWLIDASLSLRDEILKRGYHTPKIMPTPCMVDVEEALTVHYDGAIYKCISLVGHEKFSVGDVWSGMRDYRETYCLDHWKEEKKCTACEYLPLCFGGCRYMKYQREGTMAGVDCRKPHFDAVLETMLKQDIEHRLGNG